MKVNRYQELQPYSADGHFDMHCLRVQGHDASPAKTSWMGLSVLLPGGHTTLTPSPVEKLYLVLDGEVVMNDGALETTLRKFDSCYFAPREPRQLRNATNSPASVLLVMPYPPKPVE